MADSLDLGSSVARRGGSNPPFPTIGRKRLLIMPNKNPNQLIVMASHGHSGISHLAFGSVSEKILPQTNIPIFTIMPESKTK